MTVQLHPPRRRRRRPRFDSLSRSLPEGLPDGLIVIEAAIAAFRRHLVSIGRGDWAIFKTDLTLDDLVTHAGGGRSWTPLPALSGIDGGEAMTGLDERADGTLHHLPSGAFLLPAPHSACLARVEYVDAETADTIQISLIAAPSVAAVTALTDHVHAVARRADAEVWQVLHSGYPCAADRPPRPAIERSHVILEDALATRLEREVVGFFDEKVAAMYRELRVPYRRGVLLYGPPGNGKTSTIRYLGGRLPQVAALILRSHGGFDSDDLEASLKQWAAHAPAMLVIEDLNWLLQRVDVSLFLNALDGIDTSSSPQGGLLLIASTNHPDKLDPALSNRPGRFDVVAEVPLPGDDLRARFLRLHDATLDPHAIEAIVRGSDGLSLAHLAEVFRIAGLTAIGDGRAQRTLDDLLRAVELVQATNREANGGFVGKLPNFGLQAIARGRANA